MKKKYLYLGGLVVGLIGVGIACAYAIKTGLFACEPKASISIECGKNKKECPLKVSFGGKELEDTGNGFVLESSNGEISFDIVASKTIEVQLSFDGAANIKGKNGKCLPGEYRSILLNGRALPENAMHRKFISHTLKAKKDEPIKVSVQWDKTIDSNCVADYSFNEKIEKGLVTKGMARIGRWGRWTDGKKSTLVFEDLPQSDLILEFDVRPFLWGEKTVQEVVITDDTGKVLKKWVFKKGEIWKNTNIPVSGSLIKNGTLELNFAFSDLASPKDLGKSNDTRKLGIGFYTVKIKKSL